MRYYLRQQIIGRAAELQITEAEFKCIVAAKELLTGAFALEESYDLLVANYIELEQELLAAAAETLVRDMHEYQDFFYLRSTINRRVVNLLTTTRLYLDQAPQYLSTCAADSHAAKIELKKRLSEHYDTSIAYRFLEALRNHVQHCGLAVHKLSVGSQWRGQEESRVLEASVQPFTVRAYLSEDRSFKSKVLSETPAEVNLIAHIREYVQRLGDAHNYLRSISIPAAEEARRVLQKHIANYGAANESQTIGLAAVHSANQNGSQTIPLLLDWDDVRLQLIKRNSTVTNLNRRFVTGRAE